MDLYSLKVNEMKNRYYIKEELEYIELKYKEIQKRYSFEIPKYILRELASSSYNKKELCMLINMAVINKRIKIKEGEILKKEYCFRK